MERTPIISDFSTIPECFHELLSGCAVFDSSCSPQARVWYMEKDQGYYLKRAPRGSLQREAEMTRFFHSKGLSPQVLDYASLEQDWLLTIRMPGEDCTHRGYLEDPRRLSALLGERLRQLHETDGTGCPGADKMELYLGNIRKNYKAGKWDLTPFPGATAEEIWQTVQTTAPLLERTTLIHGDYCLPNVMLKDWSFAGFIDVGEGGLGDRHIDLHWGMWSLGYNLGTDAYRDRFLDAYGRDRINNDLLAAIGAFEAFG